MPQSTEESFSRTVGRRLRVVRRRRGWSLEDVEARSDGRWSASAIGAYERGYRNLTLPRLGELAEFYGVPVAVLLTGDGIDEVAPVPTDAPGGPATDGVIIDLRQKVLIDLEVLASIPDAEPIRRYARSIQAERQSTYPRLRLRRSDLPVLAAIANMSVPQLEQQLHHWDALVEAS